MKPRMISFLLLTLMMATAGVVSAEDRAELPEGPAKEGEAAGAGQGLGGKGAFGGNKLLYTTYFYTAAEAIVHGYEAETSVRIVSLDQRGTVWQGVVGPGETKLIPTGAGVFGFLSDKKAAILVGTPSACTAVGYWLRDQTGSFRSNLFYTQLPSSISAPDARLLVWARQDTSLTVRDLTTKAVIHDGKLKAGKYFELTSDKLGQMNSHTLSFEASGKDILVQVYYDEGYFVPGPDGRLAGKSFWTYVGDITQGSNDLNLFSYNREASATIRDIKSGEVIWSGKVGAGKRYSMPLTRRYVEVTADTEIAVSVTPNDFQGYNEHHFAGGVEGMGIETDFMLNASGELWLFSYYQDNSVTVQDAVGATVWSGPLQAGHAQGIQAPAGMFRVKSTKGMSVMGGWGSCGAEYSPAGGLFQIDEQLFEVASIILEERREAARKEGRELTAEQAAAPLSAAENQRARDYIKRNLNKSMSAEEVDERIDAMTVE